MMASEGNQNWLCDNEVKLLLRLTLEYKASKLQENVVWESCQAKYSDNDLPRE